MSSIFTFQSGEFYHSTPGWFDWLTLGANLLFITAGYCVAFAVYYKQRRDNAKDAHQLFLESVASLKDAVDKTIIQLTDFKCGLADRNDVVIIPILSANLNDRFFSRVDLTSLTRYYKKKTESHYQKYNDFLKWSGFIGVYHDYFLNELNEYRTQFRGHEEKFQKHRLLSANILNDVVAHLYTPHDTSFAANYVSLLKQVVDNPDIVKDGLIINRDLLNEKFVFELVKLSSKYTFTDVKANVVNGLANEVYAARSEMNNLKTHMGQIVSKNITDFKVIQSLIAGLLQT
jgi:hypothetical protein